MFPISLLKVIKGNVIMENCHFSFKIMAKSVESITPAVILEKDTKLTLNTCELAGHRTYPTMGLLCYKADVNIINSKIYSCLLGGITVLLGKFIR